VLIPDSWQDFGVVLKLIYTLPLSKGITLMTQTTDVHLAQLACISCCLQQLRWRNCLAHPHLQDPIALLPGSGPKRASKAMSVIYASRDAITLPQLLQGLSIPGGREVPDVAWGWEPC
jgi:hypothetical protein